MSFDKLLNIAKTKFTQFTDDISDDISKGINNFTSALNGPASNIRVLGELTDITGSSGAVTNPLAQPNAYSAAPGPIREPVRPEAFIPGTTPPPWPNELQNFSTMNVIMELAVLSAAEINDPDGTYRKNGPKNVVIRNGGGSAKKKVRTFYEQA